MFLLFGQISDRLIMINAINTINVDALPFKSFFFSGYYMYVEASWPRRQGDKALLTSEEFFRTSSSGRCIKFWYNMHGNSIGTLNVYYKTNTTKTVIWGLSGQQSSSVTEWKFGQAPIRSNVIYQVWFKTRPLCD